MIGVLENPFISDTESCQLTSKIKVLFDDDKSQAGSLRITKRLNNEGELVGRHRVTKIMRYKWQCGVESHPEASMLRSGLGVATNGEEISAFPKAMDEQYAQIFKKDFALITSVFLTMPHGFLVIDAKGDIKLYKEYDNKNISYSRYKKVVSDSLPQAFLNSSQALHQLAKRRVTKRLLLE